MFFSIYLCIIGIICILGSVGSRQACYEFAEQQSWKVSVRVWAFRGQGLLVLGNIFFASAPYKKLDLLIPRRPFSGEYAL